MEKENITWIWPRWIWPVYIVLFSAAIPWYWPADDNSIWLGMPAWATTSAGVSALISFFTAGLMRKYWHTPPEVNDE